MKISTSTTTKKVQRYFRRKMSDVRFMQLFNVVGFLLLFSLPHYNQLQLDLNRFSSTYKRSFVFLIFLFASLPFICSRTFDLIFFYLCGRQVHVPSINGAKINDGSLIRLLKDIRCGGVNTSKFIKNVSPFIQSCRSNFVLYFFNQLTMITR